MGCGAGATESVLRVFRPRSFLSKRNKTDVHVHYAPCVGIETASVEPLQELGASGAIVEASQTSFWFFNAPKSDVSKKWDSTAILTHSFKDLEQNRIAHCDQKNCRQSDCRSEETFWSNITRLKILSRCLQPCPLTKLSQ